MEEFDNILKAKVGTQNPFSVPEGHFENLKAAIHAKTIDANQVKPAPYYRWAFAFVATTVLIIAVWFVYPDFNTPNPAELSANENLLNEEIMMADVSTEDIIEYLNTNEIDITAIDSTDLNLNESWIEYL
jgi:hypothetical protein